VAATSRAPCKRAIPADGDHQVRAAAEFGLRGARDGEPGGQGGILGHEDGDAAALQGRQQRAQGLSDARIGESAY
jgi:hypothetical protein